MKRMHLQILRQLPGPFFGWLCTFMFLLVMQFLIRYLPELVGRGLPASIIFEIVIYNLAYMMVLAVPMSVLISTLMAFGKLAETNAYTVLKSAGVSLMQIIWPALLAGLFVTGCMWYFNNEVLPSANYKASQLWRDIRKAKPGFELTAGVFYEEIDRISIMVKEMPEESNELIDVTIFDYSDGSDKQVVIKAKNGLLISNGGENTLDLELYDGEVHRYIETGNPVQEERYERLAFRKHRFSLDLSEFEFERSESSSGYRSDRTMRTEDMVRQVDSLTVSIDQHFASLEETASQWTTDSLLLPTLENALKRNQNTDSLQHLNGGRLAVAGLALDQRRQIYEAALNDVRSTRREVENTRRNIDREQLRADKYRVEIHKKYSIAVACLIFVLVGAPLGLSIRHGGMGAVGAASMVIFLFYWVTLVQGEKLADRNLLDPWIGMWGANLVILSLALVLVFYVYLDLGSRKIGKLFTGDK